MDGSTEPQPVVPLQDNGPESKRNVQGQSDREAEPRERTRIKPTRGKPSEGTEANQVERFVQSRSFLIAAE